MSTDNSDDFLADVAYQVWESKQNDTPMTYRGISNKPDHLNKFCHRISIIWSYEPFAAGLPTKKVNDQHNLFEDLTDRLEERQVGVVALVVLGNGKKEWHWYTDDLERWFTEFNNALAEQPKYPLEIIHAENDNWQHHTSFLKWVGGS